MCVTYIFGVRDVVNFCKEPSRADDEVEVPEGEKIAGSARLDMKFSNDSDEVMKPGASLTKGPLSRTQTVLEVF